MLLSNPVERAQYDSISFLSCQLDGGFTWLHLQSFQVLGPCAGAEVANKQQIAQLTCPASPQNTVQSPVCSHFVLLTQTCVNHYIECFFSSLTLSPNVALKAIIEET